LSPELALELILFITKNLSKIKKFTIP